jgi:trehalose 6-phosphate synthase/phosphatase
MLCSQTWRQLFDGIHKEWMESVQLVFDYFCERTPRSFVETRETSLVWNYKHAGNEQWGEGGTPTLGN